MNNKIIGGEFEQQLCDYFSQQGYWAHFLSPAPDGSQPFDVLAMKNGRGIAVDAKTIKGKRFPLDRIEDNQELAFYLMNEKGNYDTYFAIKISDTEMIMVPSRVLIEAKQRGEKSVEISRLQGIYGIIHFK